MTDSPHPQTARSTQRVDRIFEAFVRWVLAHPRKVAALVCLISLVTAAGLPRVGVDASFQSLLDPDHPFVQTTNEVVEIYGEHLPLLVTLERDQPLVRRDFQRAAPFFEELITLPHAGRVAHPGNTTVVYAGEGDLSFVTLSDAASGEVPPGQPQDALSYSLIDRDKRALAAAIFLEYTPGQDDSDSVEAASALRERIAQGQVPGEFKVRLAGLVMIYAEIATRVLGDMWWLLLLSLAVTVLFLSWVYRHPTGVLAPLCVVILSQVWIVGSMGLLGVDLTIAMTLLLPLLTVIGAADALHFLNHVLNVGDHGPDLSPAEVAIRAAGRVGLPCLLTSVTTMVGFFSLVTSELRPIRAFGAMATVAVGVALLVTFSVLPLLMVRLPPRRRHDPTGRLRFDPVTPLLGAFRRLVRHRRPLIFGWTLLVAFCLLLIPQIRVETGFNEIFPQDDPLAKEIAWVEDHFWGADILGLRWQAPGEPADLLDPEVLVPLVALADFLIQQPEIDRVAGLPSFLRDLRVALSVGGPAPAWSRPLAAQLLFLLEQGEPDLIDGFVAHDRKEGVLILQVKTMGAAGMRSLVERIDAYLEHHPMPGRIEPFGPLYMYQRLTFTLVESLIRSFGLALLLVWVLVSLGLRDWKLGTLGMLPNVIPIAVAGGAMALFDTALNDSTVMVASIGIGIAVDDTVHLLIGWKRARAEGLDPAMAVDKTLTQVGRALITTSLLLLLGFGVTTASSFRPPRSFGWLSCLVVLVALWSDLLLLAAILRGPGVSQSSDPVNLSPSTGLHVSEDERGVGAVSPGKVEGDQG